MDRVFSLFGKLILVVALLAILIGAGFYFGRQTKTPSLALVTPTTEIKEVKVTVTGVVTGTTIPTATQKQVTTGSIKGVVGYPSEGIPPMDVYAVSTADSSKYYQMKTAMNLGEFTITDVDPGTYVLFAYPQNSSTSVGGYSKAVACGLSVDCKDHSLVEVSVKANETVGSVEIRDWYAPDGTFPAKPN